jgi:DNA-directed RNA polymerase subunit RPC12/RpoP
MCHHDFEIISETDTKETIVCIICGDEFEQDK